MAEDVFHLNRRTAPRLEVDQLLVSVRRKGHLTRLIGMAVDFNRHGIALLVDQPICKDTKLYLKLQSPEINIDNVIGVVHNCVPMDNGYRCGIQFRTGSALQNDQRNVEESLSTMESYLAGGEISEGAAIS